MLRYMKEHGIECNRHYPVPCHLQQAYAGLGYHRGDCPNAEHLADSCVTLPLFPEMTEAEVEKVIDCCNKYVC
jgi:dTDP-4-amino-4,6-dideoxygalactose transaminase